MLNGKIKLPKKNSAQIKFLLISMIFLLMICYGIYEVYSNKYASNLIQSQKDSEQSTVSELASFLEMSSEHSLNSETQKGIKNIFDYSGMNRITIVNQKDSVLFELQSDENDNSSSLNDAITMYPKDENEISRIIREIKIDEKFGYKLYCDFSRTGLNQMIQMSKIEIGLISLSIFIILFFTLFVVSYIIMLPLQRIADEALEISSGNLAKRIKNKRNNEFSRIALSINSLTDDLNKANFQVEKLNKELKFQFRDKIGELNYEINRKRQAENLLKQSEEQFRLLFELAPIGMVISSAYGKITKVNSSFYSMLGYDESEIIGMKISDLTYEDDKKLDSRLHDNLLKYNEQNIYYEKRLIRKDGAILYSIVKAVIVKDKSGKPSHFIEQVIDITERKRVEKELIFAKDKAEESDRLKTAFLAQMSHEIRTPLNVILAAMSIIQDDLDDADPDTKTILDSVSSSGKRLQRTIDLILNISAVQSGSYEPEYSNFNIDKELRILIDEFRATEFEKDLTISYINKAKHATITADHYSVMQIFQNLVSNAIKYTPKGKVEIILDEVNNEKIQVIIKDTGIGMSKEYMAKIFSPFSQEDVGHKREFEGNGLGLALVKKYVEINKAEILVESEKNKGSIFTVIFNKKIDEMKYSKDRSSTIVKDMIGAT